MTRETRTPAQTNPDERPVISEAASNAFRILAFCVGEELSEKKRARLAKRLEAWSSDCGRIGTVRPLRPENVVPIRCKDPVAIAVLERSREVTKITAGLLSVLADELGSA